MTEAGFFPAASYILTTWYKRFEVQRRMVLFYASASLAGAFSGLLAFAFQKMEGVRGLHGWQWSVFCWRFLRDRANISHRLFIIEGLVPILFSLITWKLLPDSPDTAWFLKEEERKFIKARLVVDTGSGRGKVTNDDKLRVRHVVAAFREWKIWAMLIVFWGNTVTVYG